MAVFLDIESLAVGGEAIARHEGQVVFVAGAVPGERVEAQIVETRERSARAQVLRVLEPSALRREPQCPHFPECGGCQWLHVACEEQLRAKEAFFYGNLERIGGLPRAQLRANPILDSGRHSRYRTRTKLHLTGSALGYLQKGSHALVDVAACRLLDERIDQALGRLRRAVELHGHLPRCFEIALACDERRVAASFYVAATGKAVVERAERLVRAAELDGAVLVAGSAPARLLGKPVLSSPASLAPGVQLRGRPDLFAQANPHANALLVAEAMRLLGTPGNVLELYGGAGNFTFALAAGGARVTSVEICCNALELARASAAQAGLTRTRFIVGDALKTADALAREGQHFDALVLDPPRTGAKGIAPLATRLGVRRILYVSCDPATLARDARELAAAGFVPLEATPVDMFPQTFHVEGLLLLERS